VFSQRAKLFRYSPETKEWKERGVGELKILHHRENGTYRLLMRREQVHKLVLNQLITASLSLSHLATSSNAWCWAGMNFAEGESNLEELAVRFKVSTKPSLVYLTYSPSYICSFLNLDIKK
jgi:E3 SUMO-protein ligase RanBP2